MQREKIPVALAAAMRGLCQ